MQNLCQNETIIEPLKILDKKIENIKENITKITLTKNENENVIMPENQNPLVRKGIIYLITNNVNDKKYVGITTRTLKERWWDYTNEVKNKKHSTRGIVKAMRKYGIDNFSMERIEECLNITEKDLLLKETFYIDKFNTMIDNDGGYNMVSQSDRLFISDLTKQKMSNSKKGHKNNFYGKHHTDESKKKMGAAKLDYTGENNPFHGKNHTDKYKKKASKFWKNYWETHTHSRTGKTSTDESKAKMSASMKNFFKNRHPANYDTDIITFRNLITNDVYIGTSLDFCKKYSMGRSSVCNLKRGLKKTYKNWIIEKIEKSI